MKSIRLIMIATILASFTASAAWAAGTPEQRAACHDDAFRFCPHDVPNPTAIEACLKRHIRSISPACQAQFGYTPAKIKRTRR